MRIVKVILEGYQRLKLNNIKYVELTAHDLVQLIIGTNGSGKSSLLEQTTVWPADRKDFKVGGRKYVELEHNGIVYKVVQHFNKKNSTFEFWMDEDNLNEGGTGHVQKELIWQHFQLDGDLIDLFQGRIKFTTMNPTQRREWISRIGDLQLDYGMDLFKRVSSSSRDVKGAKKVLENRLVKESAEIPDADEITQLEMRRTRLSEIITNLMELRNPKATSLNEAAGKVKRLKETIAWIVNSNFDRVMKLDGLVHAESGIVDLETIENHVWQLDHKLTELDSEKKFLIDSLEKVNRELEGYQDVVSADVDALQQSKLPLQNMLTAYGMKAKQFHIEDSIDRSILQLARRMQESVNALLWDKTVIDYQSRVSVSEMAQLNLSLPEVEQSINQHAVFQDRIRSRLKYAEETTEEECPSCHHKFKPGVKPGDVEKLNTKLQESAKKTTELEKDREKMKEDMEDYARAQGNLNEFKVIRSNYPTFEELWQSIDSVEGDFNPQVAIQQVDILVTEMTEALEIKDTAAKIAEIDHQIQRSSLSAELKEQITKLETARTEAENKLNKLLEERDGVEATLRQFTTLSKEWKTMIKLESEIETTMTEYDQALVEMLDAKQEVVLKADIDNHQEQLATLLKRWNTYETQNNLVKDIEQQLVELNKEQELWNELVNALSPTHGLIADMVNGFIGEFVRSLNGIIDRVWEHELKVLPGKGGANLDYKFPMQVDGSAALVPDISLGSTGQKDIIDFAFILLTMTHMGMTEFPLYADELGSSFDEHHRENLQRFLKTLLDSGHCSQIWIISHAYAVQNSLGKSSVCVIDKSNITVPVSYNDHVIFK